MNEVNYITPNLDEGYSPEAIANMENALEEFIVSLLDIKPEDANIAVFRGLKLTIKGRPRRLAELGNVESPDDPMKIELMIYNKEQIEQVLEFIKQNDNDSIYEELKFLIQQKYNIEDLEIITE